MFKLIPSRRMTDGLSESFFILLFLIMPVNIVDTQPLEEDLSSKRKEDEKEDATPFCQTGWRKWNLIHQEFKNRELGSR